MTSEEELRFLILGAQREGNRVLISLLAPLGITPSQGEVLRCLADAGPLSLIELGRRLVCETGSPSRLVSTLVEKGWVSRRENRDDRRQVSLVLTDEGRRLEAQVREVERQLHEWIGSRLDPDTIAALSKGLHRLLEGSATGAAIHERAAPPPAKGERAGADEPPG